MPMQRRSNWTTVVDWVNNEDQDLRFHVSPKFKVSAGMVRALHQEKIEF